MALWNMVETEFAGGETANFGERKETGMYQVDTVATISTQDKTAGTVGSLLSTALGELVCVGVDRHLSIFKDSLHSVTLAYENDIEDCAWSPDGSLLLVVDAGGKLYIFDTETLQPVFSCNLLPSGRPGQKTFRQIVFGHNNDVCDLLLLSASGLLFVVKGFDPAAFAQGGETPASVAQEQLKFRSVQTADVHTVSTRGAVPLGDGGVITVGCGDSVMALWQWQDTDLSLEDTLEGGCGIISAKLASNNILLCALQEDNQVSVWLVPELVMLACVTLLEPASGTHITDFLLLEAQGAQANSLEGSRLVVQESGERGSTFRIVAVETGRDIYTLQLGSTTALAACPLSQESLYVAEGTPLDEDPNQVSTIRLRCLTETYPETRLQRILQKKRFQEALEFAKLFQLDQEIVHVAQMNELLDQLSPWNVVSFEEDKVTAMLTQLWTSVDSIKDGLLIAENCMRTGLPTFSDTWKLLQLCQSKLSSSATADTERQQALQAKVLALQNRLVTYKLAFGAEAYKANHWMTFQTASLLTLMFRKMTEHEPDVALLLWRRHACEWHDHVKGEVIQQILQAVPQSLVGPAITGWLQADLLPYVTAFLPHAMGDVVQWAIQRAGNMELVEQADWPQNAITFLDGLNSCIAKVTEVNFTTTNNTALETASKSQIRVLAVKEPLSSTLSMLRQLQELRQYNLKLSSQQFQQETRESLAWRMLDQVVMVELIKPALEQHITPYMRAYRLDQDNILATYVKDLLERSGHVRSYTGRSAWEDKVLAIVSFISSPKEKCCAVSNVIEHAPLPWSCEITQLVEEGLKIQHPKVRELQQQKKIAGVRQLMQEYGLKSCSVPSKSNAERLALYMVEQDRPRSLDDGLRVLRELSARPGAVTLLHFRHANVLIRSDRVLDYLGMLRGLEAALACELGRRVVSLADVCLQDECPQSSFKQVMDQHKQHMTLAAVLTLQYIMPLSGADPVDQEEMRMQLDLFSMLYALQREYKMIMSVSDYNSEINRGRMFALYTQQYLKDNTPFKGTGDLTVLYRLAELLQLKREVVQGELALVEARAGNLDAVLCLCRHLLQAEPSRGLGGVLHGVVSTLLHLQCEGQSEEEDDAHQSSTNQEQRRCLPLVLQKLADRLVQMCDPELLTSSVELARAARLWQQVSCQCEATDSAPLQLEGGEPHQQACRDDQQSLTVETLFVDEGLVMSSAVALPLAASALAATVAAVQMITGDDDREEDEEDSAPAENAVSCLQPAVAHLKENSHLQLALGHLVFTCSALTRALLQHDMGFPLAEEVQTQLAAQRSVMQAAEKRAVQMFHSLVTAQLLKVLSAHRVDQKLALGYLLSVPRKLSVDCLMKSIKSCNYNFRRLKAIAGVGVALGHLLMEAKVTAISRDLETGATWGVKLGKLKVSFKEAFQGGVTSKLAVIANMARCPQADVGMVADFCLDFKMEVESGLMVFMEELLKSWQGPSELARARSAVVAVEIGDRADNLIKKLKAVYKQTSPYSYEVIEFLLGEINRLDPSPLYEKGEKLVSYLKVYSRRNPPSEHELTSLTATHENTEECGGETRDVWLHQGSAQRIPIHLLLDGDPWKIIKPELEAETVPLWIKIAELLGLSTDEVYMMAVQNIVRRHVSQTTSPPPTSTAPTDRKAGGGSGGEGCWRVGPASLRMLEEVQALLGSVRQCEMALACATWVVRELPMGGDKVLGLEGCVAFAQQWYDTLGDNPTAKKALSAAHKFQKVLRRVLTERALYDRDLAEPSLLPLVGTPLDLITSLTQHPAVVATTWEGGPKPDIYSTMHKVCEVNDLDIDQVLVTALQKWLLSPGSAQDAETTMNLSFSNLKMTEDETDTDPNDNIKRVLYFLHRGPKDQMLSFLSNTLQTGEGENSSHEGRMHCLNGLLQIADDSDLAPLGHSCQSIKEMLRVHCYLAWLEEIHVQHSAKTFNACNKGGLVKSIWRNHRHQKSAVRLSAVLYLDYKLYDRQQWTAILQQMMTLHMLSELSHALQSLQSVPSMWSLSVLPAAWQAVLLGPLNTATLPLSEDDTKKCLQGFNLLQSCPVLGQLDVGAVTGQFRRLELSVCVAACMLLDGSVSRCTVQEFLSQDSARLLEDCYSLTRLGLNLPTATQVREVIFLGVLQQGDYHQVAPYALQDFVQFIIRQDDINGCLLFAVSNDMLTQAESLMQLYFERYPARWEEVEDWCLEQGYELDSGLQAYLHMNELV